MALQRLYLTPQVAPQMDNAIEHRRQLAFSLNRVIDGKVNSVNVPGVTLTPGATSTTQIDLRCGTESVVLLMPLTPDAATDLTNCWIQTGVNAQGQGYFTVNHLSKPQTDRTFRYIVLG